MVKCKVCLVSYALVCLLIPLIEVECDGIVNTGDDSDVVLSRNGSSSSNGICMLIVICPACMFTLCLGLENVKLPPKMKKRGRPKGAEKTIIGLPCKKKKTDKPTPFLKKQPIDKERGMSYMYCTVCIYFTITCMSSYPTLVCESCGS